MLTLASTCSRASSLNRAVLYITVDNAITVVQNMGRGTLMTKIDIKSAFRLLPVHPADPAPLACDEMETATLH